MLVLMIMLMLMLMLMIMLMLMLIMDAAVVQPSCRHGEVKHIHTPAHAAVQGTYMKSYATVDRHLPCGWP